MSINKTVNSKVVKIPVRILMVILVVSIIFLVPLILAYANVGHGNSNLNSIQDVVNQCKPSANSVSEASSCVVKATSSFYKYNPDNMGKDLTFSELKSQGGVCSSWSSYYSEVGKDLGYNTKNVVIPTIGDAYHEFSVWSGSSGYCVVDQTEAKCFNFTN